MNATLWGAIGEQAAIWRRSPVVAAVRPHLPRNGRDRGSGLTGALQVTNAGTGVLSRPLQLFSRMPFGAQLHPTEMQTVLSHEQWWDGVWRLEGAHRLTIAWLRARLPGYPQIPVPQLVPGSPHTTEEFTYDLVWERRIFGQGLQFVDPVPGVSATLGLTGRDDHDLAQAARDVLAALVGCQAWEAFAAAGASLDDAARDQLAQACADLADALSPSRVDGHEPARALARLEYRRNRLEDTVAALTGDAHAYAVAFAQVDELITTACSDVFGQLVCHEVVRCPVDELQRALEDPRVVTFTTEDPAFLLDPGALVLPGEPTITEIVHVTGTGFQFGALEQTTTITGRILAGSEVLALGT